MSYAFLVTSLLENLDLASRDLVCTAYTLFHKHCMLNDGLI